MTNGWAIKILKNWQRAVVFDETKEAFEMAIKALERQIPKKPEIKKWDPALCPTCGGELSESLGDGYYMHWTHLERCPNVECCQKLDWSENDD